MSSASSNRTCLSSLLPALLPSSGCFKGLIYFFEYCIQYSRWGSTNAKHKRRIISFDWLAMLCLMHTKMQFIPWLLGHSAGSCWACCHQHHEVPFSWDAFQPHFCIWHCLIPGKELGILLCWTSCHWWLLNDLIYLDLLLQGFLSLQWINSTSQFNVTSRLADAFQSCIQIIDKNIEWDWI